MQSILDIPTHATTHDARLIPFCREYGVNFEAFTLLEKFGIFAAIGMWGEHCEFFGTSLSLRDYLTEYCPIHNETDAWDMLMALPYEDPSEAMGLLMSVASQINAGLWLGNDGEEAP